MAGLLDTGRLSGGLLDGRLDHGVRQAELEQRMGAPRAVKAWWEQLHPLDKTALITGPVPVVGDVAGLLADARMFIQEPESRTPLNFGLAGLGLLPFVPSAMGTIKRVGGVADDLPMDQASRLARARELGFNTDNVLYHGTKSDISEFSKDFLGEATSAPSAKRGFFFSDSPVTAESYPKYAKNMTQREYAAMSDEVAKLEAQAKRFETLSESVARKYTNPYASDFDIGMDKSIAHSKKANEYWRKAKEARKARDEFARNWLTEAHTAASVHPYNQDMASLIMQNDITGANIVPVYLKESNPYIYDFAGKEYREKTFKDLLDQAVKGGHDSAIFKNVYDSGLEESLEEYGKVLKKKFDDIHVVFSPEQIRSIFAKFDPAKKHSGEILAGAAGLGLLSGMREKDKEK